MSHPCAVPNCTTPAKDGHLMCWPHWRRVPKALNRAIFDTCANGPHEAYRANVAEAVRVIQQKEARQ
jgi:hypothetical protein